MSSRQERLARNEAASRSINEQIGQAHEGQPPGRFLRVVCECGRASCDRVVAITLPEYKRVRAAPERFVVVHEHVMEEIERRVDETDRFAVVAKREGTPRQVAREEDPPR